MINQVQEPYKGYVIIVEQYLHYARSFSYQIIDPSGKKIVDTLWNDDKMWKTTEEAIISARKTIDNPDSGYMRLFQIKSVSS